MQPAKNRIAALRRGASIDDIPMCIIFDLQNKTFCCYFASTKTKSTGYAAHTPE